MLQSTSTEMVEAFVISGTHFSFFATRQRQPAKPRFKTNDTPQEKPHRFWHRRAPTTFQKCLAVHMYYAAKEKGYW